LFTITSGVLGLALIPFAIASVVGRASQFFLVAALVWWGGSKIEPVLDKWIEWIGWGVLIVAAAGFLVVKAI
jgi:membrane protein DedA with SNARE-associated domain